MIALLLLACPSKDEETATPQACDVAPGCVVVEGLEAALLSVRAPADDDVWAVGASDSAGPLVLHFDGTSWARLDTSAWAGAEIWWAHVTPDEVVMVGSEGLLLELDRNSGALERRDGPAATVTFFGVWGDEVLWAVGQDTDGDGTPVIWRRVDGAWASMESPVTDPGAAWFKVDGTSDDDLWLVGSPGLSARWDGQSLTPVPTDGDVDTTWSPLLTVDVGGDRPLAVGGSGNALVLEHDGGAWKDRSPAFVPGLNGVCATPGVAWVVGVHGARARRGPDGWVADLDDGLAPLTVEDWHACDLSPSGALWMVGGRISSRPLVQGVLAYYGDDDPPAPGN